MQWSGRSFPSAAIPPVIEPRPDAQATSAAAAPSETAAPSATANFTRVVFFRSEEHTSELQSPRYLHSFPTRRSSDLVIEPRPDAQATSAAAAPSETAAPSATANFTRVVFF